MKPTIRMALYFALIAPMASLQAQSPNILLINADDLGLQLSSYGDQNIQTPVLDKLAREGVRFTNAYVASPSCSPSRAALLTGLWPHQSRQVGLAPPGGPGFQMRPGQTTLPTMLRDAGYFTGIIGKLHVLPVDDVRFDWEALVGARTRDVPYVAERSREFFAAAKQANKPFFYYVNYYPGSVKLMSR